MKEHFFSTELFIQELADFFEISNKRALFDFIKKIYNAFFPNSSFLYDIRFEFDSILIRCLTYAVSLQVET